MVHIFSCLGRDFALDTESGTLLQIEAPVKKVLQKLSPADNSSGDFLVREKFDNIDADSFAEFGSQNAEKEAEEEIRSLIKDGLLFTPVCEEKKPEYSGLVKALCLNVSHNCNLRCKYCFADGGSYTLARKNMDFDTAKAAIDFLIKRSGKRKNLEVDFFGGEPLLNMDVVKKTVSYARSLECAADKKFRFTITTNGVGLNDDLINYFNNEMHNVVISIDGRESVHNSVRPDVLGQGSFLKALEAAKKFRSRRGDKFYYIRGTFTAWNLDFAADVLALNDYGFDQISLEPVVLPSDHPLALTESDLPVLKQQYDILAEEYIKRRRGNKGGGAVTEHSLQESKNESDCAVKDESSLTDNEKWFNFFHFMLDLKGGPCLKKRITGCGAGCEYLAVNPDGDMFPCHRFDGKNEYKIGNVLSGEFEETIPKDFAASSIYTKKECQSCFCKYYCGGGCSANSIEYGGGINGQYHIGCELMKKRVETALAIWAIESENADNQ